MFYPDSANLKLETTSKRERTNTPCKYIIWIYIAIHQKAQTPGEETI